MIVSAWGVVSARREECRVINKRLGNVVIVLVCVIWAANFGAQFVVAEYKPDPTINMIFMGIVGGLFALQSRKSGDNANSTDQEDENSGGGNK